MNRNKLKTYAPQARRDFIAAVTDRAGKLGITAGKGKLYIEPVQVQGDLALIGGRPYLRKVATQRRKLEERIHLQGFEQVMEAMAYTWFNRLMAIRFMETTGYLDHGYHVLSPSPHWGEGRGEGRYPEILEQAEHVDLPGLDKGRVIELKLAGNRDEELYRQLLIAQCNALSQAMPFLFERIDDETELLLPDNLLHSDSVIRRLVAAIPEEDWREIEIVGWLYQFYISEKKDQVIGKVVESEDIPAATQLFTPNWIVKYLLHNSLGRQWLATYPDSALKGRMAYYIEPVEQSEEVKRQLAEITLQALDPEAITALDPACGSGHILVEAYELMKAIYQERGYRSRDIPALILTKNLYGLEIDDRAAQLAAFALMMKARADDRRIFEREVRPNVLAIQHSKGLDAEDLAQRLCPEVEESLFGDSDLFPDTVAQLALAPSSRRNYTSAANSLASKGGEGEIIQDTIALLKLFEHGKTFGSLITVPQSLVERLPELAKRVQAGLQGDMLAQEAARTLSPYVRQALYLADKYDVVVANPPYMGSKGMNPLLKDFAKKNYPETKADLFAIFIERGFGLAKPEGYNAMVTMQSWMFLSSYQAMRERLLAEKTIVTMAHLGARAFSEISGEIVQTTAFTFLNNHLLDWRPVFFRLVEGQGEEKQKWLRSNINRFDRVIQDDCRKVSGSVIAYWVDQKVIDHFSVDIKVSNLGEARRGLQTGDSPRFIRNWFEVSLGNLHIEDVNREKYIFNNKKWFLFNNGGEYRKWSGAVDYVVNWKSNGKDIKETGKAIIPSEHHYFKKMITWSRLSGGITGFRYVRDGIIPGDTGPGIFFKDDTVCFGLLSYLNSCVAVHFLEIIVPTLTFLTGDIENLPVLLKSDLDLIGANTAKKCIEIAKKDWDSFETSWDFQSFPWLTAPLKSETTEQSWRNWEAHCRAQIKRMQELETENNRLFIEAYGLQDELTPEVPEDQITLARPDCEADVKRLISYAIGCMMGRYRLDRPGLIYAHSGNQNFERIYHHGDTEAQRNNQSKNNSVSPCLCGEYGEYGEFPPDQDGIIPLTETDWFEDDAANRFIQFLKATWSESVLTENLKFIADSLDPKRGETPQETLRRYLANRFYKDHLQIYKRRPIYWLFSSGKQGAFQTLVYLHRYHEGTLARMRMEYVIPLQGRIAARIEQLEGDISAATSTANRKKLEKERDVLLKQQAELSAFDDKLRHYADQRIGLDLDDGVKVNYGKFSVPEYGELLAESKAVMGN